MLGCWSVSVLVLRDPSRHHPIIPLPHYSVFHMKNVVLLGSTGSIGASTLKVAEDLPDRIRLVGLAAGSNTERLAKQTLKHRPEAVSINDPAKARELETLFGVRARVYCGKEGLLKLATLPSA